MRSSFRAASADCCAPIASWCAFHRPRCKVIGVEPTQAACLQASARAGRPVAVDGPLNTTMAGLRNREVSPLAFAVAAAERRRVHGDRRWVGARRDAALAHPAEGDPAIAAGASGAAALGGLLAVCRDASMRGVKQQLGLGPGIARPRHRQRGRDRSRSLVSRDDTTVNTTVFRGGAVALLFVALTVVMTWPQAPHLSTQVYDSDDPLLSIWRISWIAHILPIAPADLLNGNIFHPEKRTLAYTDSTLLEGLAGAPLIWSGVSPVTTYNVLLLLSIALSGWAMWRYALYLTGHSAAAILAGIMFAFVPFRFDHFHHLELQATIFLPLTLLYFERTFDSGSRRDAWLLAASSVAQVYSCIYYSIFLVTALVPIAAVRLWRMPADARAARDSRDDPGRHRRGDRRRAVRLRVRAQSRDAWRARRRATSQLYSATLANYLATTPANVIHGGWSAQFGQAERYLFPGVLAIGARRARSVAIDRRRATLLVDGGDRLRHLTRVELAVLRAAARGGRSRIAACGRRRAHRSSCSSPLPRSARTAGRA